ncbi:hypothetical protein B0A49_07353 [Cryomyces minteri]|uniref:Uncharacterized protein n=1 Tax=Cryomyces minteri TaxID=331657 RepID=A0A4U0X5X4_9PEZI|nr:hypothetical protein B0A49_07353 [Cryomyces minteri]
MARNTKSGTGSDKRSTGTPRKTHREVAASNRLNPDDPFVELDGKRQTPARRQNDPTDLSENRFDILAQEGKIPKGPKWAFTFTSPPKPKRVRPRAGRYERERKQQKAFDDHVRNLSPSPSPCCPDPEELKPFTGETAWTPGPDTQPSLEQEESCKPEQDEPYTPQREPPNGELFRGRPEASSATELSSCKFTASGLPYFVPRAGVPAALLKPEIQHLTDTLDYKPRRSRFFPPPSSLNADELAKPVRSVYPTRKISPMLRTSPPKHPPTTQAATLRVGLSNDPWKITRPEVIHTQPCTAPTEGIVGVTDFLKMGHAKDCWCCGGEPQLVGGDLETEDGWTLLLPAGAGEGQTGLAPDTTITISKPPKQHFDSSDLRTIPCAHLPRPSDYSIRMGGVLSRAKGQPPKIDGGYPTPWVEM